MYRIGLLSSFAEEKLLAVWPPFVNDSCILLKMAPLIMNIITKETSCQQKSLLNRICQFQTTPWGQNRSPSVYLAPKGLPALFPSLHIDLARQDTIPIQQNELCFSLVKHWFLPGHSYVCIVLYTCKVLLLLCQSLSQLDEDLVFQVHA